MDQNELLKIFYEEAEEHLQRLESSLLQIEDVPDDPETIDVMFRAAHTLKGSAGIVGLAPISEITHVMENLLEKFRKHEAIPEGSDISILLKACDHIKNLMYEAINGEIVSIEENNNIIRELEEHLKIDSESSQTDNIKKDKYPSESLQHDNSEQIPGDNTYTLFFKLSQDVMETGTDPVMLLMELYDCGEIKDITPHTDELPDFNDLDVHKLYIYWTVTIKTSLDVSILKNIFIFVEDGAEISITETQSGVPLVMEFMDTHGKDDYEVKDKPIGEILVDEGTISTLELDEILRRQKRVGQILVEEGRVSQEDLNRALKRQDTTRESIASSIIRVETKRLDDLFNLIGELIISLSRIKQTFQNETVIESHEQIVKDLQDKVMQIRMIPIEGVFNRFKRTVRDLANELGKEIDLKIMGAETELDKTLVEKISDPLKHLIRNSVDHGIELPEERLKNGKSREGHIALNAYHQEGMVIIEINDDGHGIDREIILKKAMNKGLISNADDELLDRQIFEILFLPGFSTAESVSKVSGRGVGLDVVKKDIEDLGGKVIVTSQKNKGTTFTITLPLTLAIIDGMKFRIGDEVFILPKMFIIEMMRPTKEQIKILKGKGEVVLFRGEYLSILKLGKIFNIKADSYDSTKSLLIVIESQSRRFVLMVDELFGEMQAVIKSIEKNFQKVDGIAGASILGDGSIALIVDIHSLEKKAFAA